ncbi:MAG: hypothetical protein ACR2LC_16960 [Pyrinomonadaceae bacterium]
MSTSIEIRNDMLRAILTPGTSKPKKQPRESCLRCGLVRRVASTIQINILDNVEIDGRERSHFEYAPLCARCTRREN